MKLDANNPEDVNLGLEMMLTAAILASGGTITVPRADTVRISTEGIRFTFTVNEKGEGVFGLKWPTAEELEAVEALLAIAEALGVSVEELINA